MKMLYTAHATTIAGREGHSETDDKRLSLKLSSPGKGSSGTNPEQLFACGYSACFGSAIDAIAKKKELMLKEIKVQADVALNQADDGGYFLSVVLNVSLLDIEQSLAEHLIKDAHKICPYSKATRNNVVVKLKANNREISYNN